MPRAGILAPELSVNTLEKYDMRVDGGNNKGKLMNGKMKGKEEAGNEGNFMSEREREIGAKMEGMHTDSARFFFFPFIFLYFGIVIFSPTPMYIILLPIRGRFSSKKWKELFKGCRNLLQCSFYQKKALEKNTPSFTPNHIFLSCNYKILFFGHHLA